MNKELHDKILADLDKTGFGSEMRAIKVFSESRWLVNGSQSYYDLDSSITREIDIKAYTSINESLSNGKTVSCFYEIVAEVKKQSVPWIVFKSHTYWDFQLGDAWSNLIFHDNLPESTSVFVDTISDSSLGKKLGWKGASIHEGFKDPTVPSRWYSAFIAACKAAENSLEANTYKSDKSNEELNKSIHLFFVKPVVIFDGILISAELTDSGDILLNEIDSAPFNFSYRSPKYNRRYYHVDVVRLSALKDYIQFSRTRLHSIFEAIKQRA